MAEAYKDGLRESGAALGHGLRVRITRLRREEKGPCKVSEAMTEEYIVCNYKHQPGCICGRTIRELYAEINRMKPVVDAAVACLTTFRPDLISRSPYENESRNNKAFEQAVIEYRAKNAAAGKAYIVLNGRTVEVQEKTLSFDGLRSLAGLPFADTVTYFRAAAPESGTLTKDSWVTVKDGTVVNVSNTDGA